MQNRKWMSALVMLAMLAITAGCERVPPSAEGGEGTEASEALQGGSADGGSSAAPSTVSLAAGTPLRVRTMTALSTKSVQSGKSFTVSLEEPIVAGGTVIAPKGANVKGVVVESDPGGRVKGVARLAIRLTQLETAGGRTIDITSSTYATQARTTKKDDAKKVGIASGVGAAIGAIAGGGKGAAIGAGVGAGAGAGTVAATRGDPAVIPSESVVNFTLTDPVTISSAN